VAASWHVNPLLVQDLLLGCDPILLDLAVFPPEAGAQNR
jgi:hypothetical protein